MTLGKITDHAGEWLRGAGPHSDIVISSRIRLARNLAGYPYVSRASILQRQDIISRCQRCVLSGRLGGKVLWVDLCATDELDRLLLMERHLISSQHAKGGKECPRAVVVDMDETFAIMVNEEDHLRIQVLRSGMQLGEAYEQISGLDDTLEEFMDFSYSRRWGYLTACPTNVGTGIRVSVMLHLPALKLTGEIDKVRRAARDMHLAVRGLFGEGSEAKGDLFQISNQTTLGRTEAEILAEFQDTIIPQIISYEQQARQALQRQRLHQLDDKVWRAWALLTSARVISTEEVLDLLSHLRMGVALGRIDKADMRTINELFLLTQPAHLQRVLGSALDPAARRVARAQLIRDRLVPTA